MSDTTLTLLDELCRIRGYRQDRGGTGEQMIADRVTAELSKHSWLTVECETVRDDDGNEMPGFCNVLALDGPVEDVRFLVVGHLDTVTPSPGWSKQEFSTDSGRYYALGAVDARGGMAACLDAIARAGPTSGVAYLFYSDEEAMFAGMHDFVRRHPQIAPPFGLSVCGGPAKAHVGWRGCTEIEFLVQGKSGHASRPFDGANTAEALATVMAAVRNACVSEPTSMVTAANIAAVHVGSSGGDDFATFALGRQQPPRMNNVANKIPDIGWALLDVRPGGPEVDVGFIEAVARKALGQFNADRQHHAQMRVHPNFAMPMYLAGEEIDWLVDMFDPVHGGTRSDPSKTGFLDTGLISDLHGTQFMCLAPAGGNAHGVDEWVDTYSLLSYRDCMVQLLRRYSAS